MHLRVILAIFAFGAGLLSERILAQDVTTRPYGYFVRSLPVTGSGETQKVYLGIPLSKGAIYVGKVASVTANTITVAGTPWTGLTLGASNAPYLLKITSGTQAGRSLNILSNTESIVGLDTSVKPRQSVSLVEGGFSVQAGDGIEVVPAATLASVFGDGGANGPVQLTGASNAVDADTVGIFDASASRWDRYYFNTTRGQWEQAGSLQSCNTVKISPDAGVEIVRGASQAADTLICSGYVPNAAPRLELPGGPASARVASLSYPVNQTLGSLNYTGWKKDNSIFRADTLSVWNASTGLWDTYYQRTDNSWRKQGDANSQSSVVIPCGVAVTLLKRDASESAASLPSSPMPYTVE